MDELIEIENKFKSMVSSGKVDLNIIRNLTTFKNNLLKSKDEFLNKKQLFNQFPFFHAIETQLRIVDYLIIRVQIAPEINDNPKVADDALLVIPHLQLINNALFSKMRDPYYVLDLSTKLQVLAMRNDMYPLSEQVTSSANKSELAAKFNQFVEHAGDEIDRA